MNGQKRIIDASKGWNNVSLPASPRQYIPKQVVRQQQQQPSYTVSVNPHANIVYQRPQVQNVRHQVPQSTHHPPPTHVQQVQQPVTPVEKDTPVQSPTKDTKVSLLMGDPDMKNFDMDGCKSIEEVYEKNRNIIKIIPE